MAQEGLFFNCWVLHPVVRVSTNVFLKTTVRNNVSVLDFIVYYYFIVDYYRFYYLSGPKHVVSSAQ
jgi:hypothetical protein